MSEINLEIIGIDWDFADVEDYYGEERVSRWRDFLRIRDEKEELGSEDLETRLKRIKDLFAEITSDPHKPNRVYFYRKSGSYESDYYLLFDGSKKKLARVVFSFPSESSPIFKLETGDFSGETPKFNEEEYELDEEALEIIAQTGLFSEMIGHYNHHSRMAS